MIRHDDTDPDTPSYFSKNKAGKVNRKGQFIFARANGLLILSLKKYSELNNTNVFFNLKQDRFFFSTKFIILYLIHATKIVIF
jgi:hypothetical protein